MLLFTVQTIGDSSVISSYLEGVWDIDFDYMEQLLKAF